MSIVGAGQYLMTGGWSFWPVGDFYQLTPKWDEWYSVRGEVFHSDDEPNRYEMVGRYDGPDPYIVLAIAEDDPTTLTVIEEGVPVGTPAWSARCWRSFGFAEERALPADIVIDTEDDWVGKFVITFPLEIRQWVGPGAVLNFAFDFWVEEEPQNRVRLAYGKIVFRK